MDEITVNIDWEGPLGQTEVAKLLDPANDVGVYAVYGPHPVYGPYTLVYIGMTEDSFGARVSAERWAPENRC